MILGFLFLGPRALFLLIPIVLIWSIIPDGDEDMAYELRELDGAYSYQRLSSARSMPPLDLSGWQIGKCRFAAWFFGCACVLISIAVPVLIALLPAGASESDQKMLLLCVFVPVFGILAFVSVAVLRRELRKLELRDPISVLQVYYECLTGRDWGAVSRLEAVESESHALQENSKEFRARKSKHWKSHLGKQWGGFVRARIGKPHVEMVCPDLALARFSLHLHWPQGLIISIFLGSLMYALTGSAFVPGAENQVSALLVSLTLGFLTTVFLLCAGRHESHQLTKLLLKQQGKWRILCPEWQAPEELDLSWLESPKTSANFTNDTN